MKKGTKITLIVLGVIVALGIAVFISADVLISRVAHREMNKALANIPGCEASFGSVQVRLFSATAAVYDLRFVYHSDPIRPKDTIGPGIEVQVESIEMGRLFYSLLLKRLCGVRDAKP